MRKLEKINGKDREREEEKRVHDLIFLAPHSQRSYHDLSGFVLKNTSRYRSLLITIVRKGLCKELPFTWAWREKNFLGVY